MTTKIYKTITLDIEDFEYLKQVSRLENRSISNLLRRMHLATQMHKHLAS